MAGAASHVAPHAFCPRPLHFPYLSVVTPEELRLPQPEAARCGLRLGGGGDAGAGGRGAEQSGRRARAAEEAQVRAGRACGRAGAGGGGHRSECGMGQRTGTRRDGDRAGGRRGPLAAAWVQDDACHGASAEKPWRAHQNP